MGGTVEGVGESWGEGEGTRCEVAKGSGGGEVKTELDKLFSGLTNGTREAKVTTSQDGQVAFNPSLTANGSAQEAFEEQARRADALFAARPSYQAIKSEKPQHRIMLWLCLEGNNAKEIAAVTGYTPEHVRTVIKQPWFQEAFCRMSTDAGKDAMKTFLEGYVIEACEGLVNLARGAETDAVRLAANNSILDRVRGKPTVHVETKSSSTIDATITDVAKLMEESRRLNDQLQSRGAFIPSSS